MYLGTAVRVPVCTEERTAWHKVHRTHVYGPTQLTQQGRIIQELSERKVRKVRKVRKESKRGVKGE